MKIKLHVEHQAKGIKLWITENPDHVSGNINTVVGLRERLNKETSKFPANTDVRHIIPFFYFIAFITINTTTREEKMMLFDSENDVDKALDFYSTLTSANADAQMKNEMMKAFNITEGFYDEFKETVQLIVTE